MTRKLIPFALLPLMAQTAPPANVTMANGQPRPVTPVVQVDASGAIVTGGGGGTPTGTAGSPNPAVVSVQGVSGGTPQPVTQTSQPLPTGAATAANQTNGSQVTGLAAGTNTIGSLNNISGVVSLPTGAATETTLSGVSGKLPATLGAKTAANSLSIAPATDASFPTIGNVANGATDSGNPVKTGCIANFLTPTAVSTGQRVNNWCNLIGASNVVARGADQLTTTQVSVGTTATNVTSYRPSRSRLVITQSAAGPCYYSSASNVTATTGARLAVAGASKVYLYNGLVYGICPGGAVTVDVDEEY